MSVFSSMVVVLDDFGQDWRGVMDAFPRKEGKGQKGLSAVDCNALLVAIKFRHLDESRDSGIPESSHFKRNALELSLSNVEIGV
jgi:hypothetical protein